MRNTKGRRSARPKTKLCLPDMEQAKAFPKATYLLGGYVCPQGQLCRGLVELFLLEESLMSASWTAYVIGPFYALLPKRWRQGERHGPGTYLARAAMISGVGEAVFALVILGFWYAANTGLFSSRFANYLSTTAVGMSSEWIFGGSVGLLGFAVSPLTWLIVYFALEGVIRAFAALASDEVVGTLPLYVLAFFWGLAQRRKAKPELPLVPDEVTPGGGTCDIQIASCRKREGWVYPFTLRYAGAYFQVMDEKCIAVGPRPYIYSLRRLPIGEVARGLKNYDPADVLVPVHRLERL